MAKKKTYYDISNIWNTGAQYMILLGMRANGKSYQSKKKALENAYNAGKRFVYLRRWVLDIKAKTVGAYFDDMDIKKITNGEYTQVVAWSGCLFWGYIDEEGKLCKGPQIGYYCALNEAERYKSMVFDAVDYIIYEEFITDQVYLDDEPRKLQQFVSTVFRDRKGTVVMVGNTLSRVCPYFSEWCLDGVLKQKQGTIEIYHFHVGDSTVDIAVENCKASENDNFMFFGQAAKQIISGEWDTKDMPRLPKRQWEYEKLYDLIIEYQAFRFGVQLLCDPVKGGLILFVYPYTKKKIKNDRILSDNFSDDPMISNRLNRKSRVECKMMECFQLDKVAYSDNLTAADFQHVRSAFAI